MLSNIYYESDKEYYQKLSRDYYHNNRKRLLKYPKEKYNSLSKEEKDKKFLYAKNRYNNLPEDKKNIIKVQVKNRYYSVSDDKMLKHKEYQKKYPKNIEKIKRHKVIYLKMQY